MKRSGFTLAETVVALALFSAAAVVVCQSAYNARLALRQAERYDRYEGRVSHILHHVQQITDREVMEEGGEIELAPRVRKGDVEDDADAAERTVVRWSVEIYPTALLDVHQVTLTIAFMQAEATEEDHELIWNAYRPNWYEPGERDGLILAKQEEWERQQVGRQ